MSVGSTDGPRGVVVQLMGKERLIQEIITTDNGRCVCICISM